MQVEVSGQSQEDVVSDLPQLRNRCVPRLELMVAELSLFKAQAGRRTVHNTALKTCLGARVHGGNAVSLEEMKSSK